MRNFFVKILKGLNDRVCRILAFEALLFSGVFAAAYSSWLVFCCLTLLLWVVICFPNGKLITMIALCGMWGLAAASIGYSFGRWPWAAGLGLGFFLFGMMVHLDKLDSILSGHGSLNADNAVDWRANIRWRRENSN
jgi:hypothetical protein